MLLYGLTTDTADLHRNTHSADIKAYDILHSKADQHFLSRLAKSQVPLGMLIILRGISRRLVYRDHAVASRGTTRLMCVQVADQMLFTCGINWVVCAGKVGDTLVVDSRRRPPSGSWQASEISIQQTRLAGGHRTMGRVEIPSTVNT